MTSERSSAGMPPSEPMEGSLLAFVDGILGGRDEREEQAAVEVGAYLAIGLRSREFLLPLLACREVVRVGDITRIPEAPSVVRGVVSLRGRVLPVIDARLCLGLTPWPPTPKSRLVVVELSGRILALLVDGVTGILKLPVVDIVPPGGTEHPAVCGVVVREERHLCLLDLGRLIEVVQDTRQELEESGP